MLRERITESEAKESKSVKPDGSIPSPSIPQFLIEAGQALDKHAAGTRVNCFGHLGDGNLHYNTYVEGRLRSDAAAREAHDVTTVIYDIVEQYKGSFSAEHGIGIAKVAELVRYKDPVEVALMRTVKAALDPLGIMNPGKVL